MKTQAITHVAMSVPAGTLTDEYRDAVLDFYGDSPESQLFRFKHLLPMAIEVQYFETVRR